jgi:hypothetical protein
VRNILIGFENIKMPLKGSQVNSLSVILSTLCHILHFGRLAYQQSGYQLALVQRMTPAVWGPSIKYGYGCRDATQ